MSGGAPASPTLSHLPWAGPTDRKALFSPGGSGKAASVDLPPKLVPRSMHVCVSRPQHGRGARGWVALGAAGSAQPVSPRAKQGRPTALRAQGTRRPLCPPPVALPGGGAGRLPSPPPQAEAPSLRFLSHARCASRLARAWHGLSSASPPWGEGPAVPAPPQPPGSAGGNCGVLQGGRTVRGACTRRGSFGTGRGQGQEPEGLGGPARHHLTFSSRKGRPQPSAQGPSPWAASRPARSRS